MKFIYDDGGRSQYFTSTNVGDCVVRAIANATGIDYKEVYDAINKIAKASRPSKRERGTSNSRNGVHTRIAKKYIEDQLGWKWVATMGIGTGCQTHLDPNELPKEGNYILNLSKHFTCIKDGVLYDTYDCSRDGTRCVYGYWRKPTKAEQEQREQEIENQRLEQLKAEELKAQVELVKKSYQVTFSKLEKKIKEYQHKLVLEKNKMKREIAKIK